MPSDLADPPSVLLVSSGELAQRTLQVTVDTLDRFGVSWKWVQATDEPGAVNPRTRAVIVASPDGLLPARWSSGSGRLTIRVPVEGAGRGGLALLDDGNGLLPSGGAGNDVFATMAIGEAGARNAALFVVAALAVRDEVLRERWAAYRQNQTAEVLAAPSPTLEV